MARDVFWVLQSSIIGPLLFNTYLVDLLVIMDDIDIVNYAYNNHHMLLQTI